MVLEAEVDTESRKEGLCLSFGGQGYENLGEKCECTVPRTGQERVGNRWLRPGSAEVVQRQQEQQLRLCSRRPWKLSQAK